MEGLIKIQFNLKTCIEKALINYNKSPKQRITLEYVEVRLENLEKDWSLFRENNLKIINEYTDEADDSEYFKKDIYESVQDTYVEYRSLLLSVRNQLQIPKVVNINKNEDQSSSNVSHKSNSSIVRLPKISICNFSGKYSEWVTFRDLFVSLIHNNNSLDNVQKLHYLKGHLSGEAEQLIRHIPITDANYIQCWEKLENRYNNKKYLANCIFKKFFAQRKLFNESASGLKELLDNTTDCLNALSNLQIDVSSWDLMIIYIITDKLDTETRKQWELQIANFEDNNLPTLEQFKGFLESRFRALEYIEPRRSTVQHGPPAQGPKSKVLLARNTNPSHLKCEYCTKIHKLCFCEKFAALDYNQRHEFVKNRKMCFNCLGSNHTSLQCNKPTSCRICKRRHNTLLHQPTVTNTNQAQPTNQEEPSTTTNNSVTNCAQPVVSCHSTKQGTEICQRQVLLATALVKAKSTLNNFQTVRVLLDQGSQASFVTESTVQLLKLKKIPVKGMISGVGNDKTLESRYMVHITVQSVSDPEFEMEVTAYVLKNITSYLPDRTVEVLNWIELKRLQLADPQFDKPNRIDMLLGADIYSKILQEGIKKSPSGSLVAQCTSLGWILSGTVMSVNNNANKITVMHAQVIDNDLLKQFWEIEDKVPNDEKILTVEEQKCEEIFASSTKRAEDGRYIVELPFREQSPPCIGGNSREIAVRRFSALENKFKRNKQLKERYTEVINEYLKLGHMRLVPNEDSSKERSVYLPHHAVVREDKSTTKVRVVFDASCKNENGVSLNDTLMVGPMLQSDLRHIVSRWRTHAIALVSDIVKMYRQVRVAEEHTAFQRIVWRENPEDELKDYELLTVTFGTASAPYLAIKTLHQVAIDEGNNYPLAAQKVPNSFYMDDLMTGSSTMQEGEILYQEMRDLLSKGGFELQKWNSNSEELLRLIESEERKRKHLDQDNNEKQNDQAEKNIFDVTKILGLTWSPSEDVFKYSVQLPSKSEPETKRTIISDIARLYDPLGWIAPAIVIAKIMIQKIWLAGVGWDEEVPTALKEEWTNYRNELTSLTEVRVTRWLGMTGKDECVELHGFSDASKTAYAAVVYTRTVLSTGQVRVSLLVAKTKVAPIKQISIPRLELCGALLLARLLAETAKQMNIPKNKVHAWTDSTVVLAWLNSHPSRWKTFVANRVAEILTISDANQWAHVSTKNNPADCASRGIRPSSLADHRLWFDGPEFLREKEIKYQRPETETKLEENVKVFATVHKPNQNPESPWNKFSSLNKLKRVVAYCKRLVRPKKSKTLYLSSDEINEAFKGIIKECQRRNFKEDYRNLKENGCVGKSSTIKSLSPYLDENDIIRVGGRLEKSSLPEPTKHPIILPRSDHLTQLIVADAHDRLLHGGPQLLVNYLRTGYWIIGVKNIVKRYVRKCVTCIRHQAKISNQFMGSLPSPRCNPTRAFLHSGVDYAGPINIRTTKGRGHRSTKGYICVFICMSTRAIHLEAVSDMSSQAFLAAFRRFVSRRGHCAQMWSDNGTNFVGAARELKELVAIQETAIEKLESLGTKWHFIPPQTPNMGGLWEAAVKSTKFHLKRVIGESTLTYEELSTLLVQIEACLNSRPLTVVSDDNDGLMPLTPGHFLVGGPLLAVPDVDYRNSPISLLTRWNLLQKMLQNFWKRWSSEYLTTLVHRYKWSDHKPEPQIGDIVLVKENDMPPSRWLMGRIEQKHPGDDGITRVVTLRTERSTFKRPTSKIIVLPVQDE